MDYKEIAAICEKYNIRNWTIDGGLVNVDGNVIISGKELEMLPLNFGKISGNFGCYNNKIITLEGSPYHIDGSFYCSYNELVSLKYAPKYIGKDFNSFNNKLASLKYLPMHIGGNCIFDDNNIYDIYDIPGKFNIFNNPAIHIYKYMSNSVGNYIRLMVDIPYFNDCKILLGKDIYINRFKAFLDSYGLYSNIDAKELKKVGYTIK